jgi:hypothetical protein
MLMMAMVPAVVFWIDVKEFDWLLKIPMTMLLSIAAFEFAIARDLPRIGYITFLDAVVLTSFAFCFFCILEIATVFLMHQRGEANFRNEATLCGALGLSADLLRGSIDFGCLLFVRKSWLVTRQPELLQR